MILGSEKIDAGSDHHDQRCNQKRKFFANLAKPVQKMSHSGIVDENYRMSNDVHTCTQFRGVLSIPPLGWNDIEKF